MRLFGKLYFLRQTPILVEGSTSSESPGRGEGARGGGRALVALKVGCRAVLMFGWEKKDMENITSKELKVYRLLAKRYLGFTDGEMNIAVDDGTLREFRQPR
jgi:hypothetical protein